MNIDKKQFSLKLQLELIWWLITAIIVFMVIYPIINNMVKYEFLISNIIFICVFITYSRFIFLLKHSFLAYFQAAKFVIIFMSIPLIFKLIEWIFNYQSFLQTEGLQSFSTFFKPNINFKTQQQLLNYMSREFLFFGVGAVIAAVVLPFRLLISYWRVYNKKGTV
jgi:hypothetical protein